MTLSLKGRRAQTSRCRDTAAAPAIRDSRTAGAAAVSPLSRYSRSHILWGGLFSQRWMW